MSGWIALHRGWRDCDVFEPRRDPMADEDAWLWMIEHTAWKEHRRRGGQGQSVSVKRGQLHASDRTLAAAFMWDKKRVRRFLDRLEKCSMIEQHRDQSGTTLTICNYDKYQEIKSQSGPVEDQLRDQPRTSLSHGNNIENTYTAQETGPVKGPYKNKDKQENNHHQTRAQTEKPAPDFAITHLMSRCCEAAGMPVPDPMRDYTKHSKALAAVQGWVNAGIGEAAMLAKIREVSCRAPSQIQSLGYFDAAVREVSKAAMPTQQSDAMLLASKILEKNQLRKHAA